MKTLISFIIWISFIPTLQGKAFDIPVDMEIISERVVNELLKTVIDQDQVMDLMGTINEEGFWPGINYEDVSRIAYEHKAHVQHIKEMSLAFRKPDSPLYKDQKLQQALSSAIDFWIANDFIADNWHTNEISNPSDWVSILLLMKDRLSQEQVEGLSKLAERANLNAWGARPGGDLIKIAGIMAELALVHRNGEQLQRAVDAMVAEVKISSGTGIKPDLGFHHRADRVTSILSYGTGYAATFANWAYRLEGTEYKFPEQAIKLLVDYYLDGICQSMVHAWYKDPGVINRDMSRESTLKPVGPEIPEKLLTVTDYRKDELEKVVNIRKGLQAPDLQSNRFFWHSEYSSHQRPGYFASVRMHSDRNHNMESPHNQESLKMHHFADGSNFISRTGKEFYDIYPVWDWQKIPGTTVVQKPELPHWNQIVKQGKTDFVGAVTDGIYGATVFDFDSPHDALKARKAWFFFDEEYVCLGAGIHSEAEFPVITTLNQTLLHSDVQIMAQNKQTTLSKGEHQVLNVSWVWQDSVGYFFPDPVSVSINNKSYTGTWQSIVNTQQVKSKAPVTKEIFSLWIDHGKKPQGASYEYVVVPGINSSGMENYLTNPPIRTIANTSQIQAVQHLDLNLTHIVFYQPGSLQLSNGLTITTKSAGLVMVRTDEQGIEKITIADPSRKLKTFEFEITADFKGHGTDWKAHWNDKEKKSSVLVALPSGDYAGKSLALQNNKFQGEEPQINKEMDFTKGPVQNGPSEGKHHLGERFGGGMVIWVDESGEHGLVAALQDQSGAVRWKNGQANPPQLYGDHGDRFVNAGGDGIYAGASNTILIIAQQTADDLSGDFAAKVCSGCNQGGYGDWYLPSKAELDILFQNKDAIGGFSDNMYGSSTEYNIGFVWGQIFNIYGGQFVNNKGSEYAVRCVRKF